MFVGYHHGHGGQAYLRLFRAQTSAPAQPTKVNFRNCWRLLVQTLELSPLHLLHSTITRSCRQCHVCQRWIHA